jgi:TPR repeat protein
MIWSSRKRDGSKLHRAVLASGFVALAACTPSLGPPPAEKSAAPSATIDKEAAQRSIADGLDAWKQGDTEKSLTILRKVSADDALRPLANAGDPKAQVAFGRVVENSGMPEARDEAAKWYQRAADQGDPDGLTSIGLYYQNGEGGLPKDTAKARALYEQAAAKDWAPAMTNLGDFYATGNGVPADMKAALTWYRKAADLGDANAMYSVGQRYEHGDGVPQDFGDAKNWYERGAKLDHAGCIERLGAFYLAGKDVPLSYITARQMFESAAAKGLPQAMYDLAKLYSDGDGVSKDPVEAYVWAGIAMRNYPPDDPHRADGQKLQTDLAGKLSAADRAKAQKRIDDWKPRRAGPAA